LTGAAKPARSTSVPVLRGRFNRETPGSGELIMSIVKTGILAASFALVASFAHADSSVPVQGLTEWNKGMSAYASAQPQPRMQKGWTNSNKAPFSREATENKSGH
jgi:hypothetical protein